MAQLLVRDLDEDLVGALKAQAREHHRSLQGEVKAILERHIGRSNNTDLRARLATFHAGFGGKLLPDSTQIIREMRDER